MIKNTMVQLDAINVQLLQIAKNIKHMMNRVLKK